MAGKKRALLRIIKVETILNYAQLRNGYSKIIVTFGPIIFKIIHIKLERKHNYITFTSPIDEVSGNYTITDYCGNLQLELFRKSIHYLVKFP